MCDVWFSGVLYDTQRGDVCVMYRSWGLYMCDVWVSGGDVWVKGMMCVMYGSIGWFMVDVWVSPIVK